jgi:hypothetical protein
MNRREGTSGLWTRGGVKNYLPWVSAGVCRCSAAWKAAPELLRLVVCEGDMKSAPILSGNPGTLNRIRLF